MLKRFLGAAALALALPTAAFAAHYDLLNVSYDPTRELYRAINARFIAEYEAKTGDTVTIQQSHGGSGKQSRAVFDGLDADVVTLALGGDILPLVNPGKLINPDWESRLPDHASPYTSTIVFLVRKGNPKHIKDWGDLVRPGISVITPNPKTSGGARWNFLAAYAYALQANGNDAAKARAYLTALFKNVPVLDTGARGATTTFVQRGLGDVLLAWENEAFLAKREFGDDQFEIVVPSISILAEPQVAVVDKVVDKKGTRKVAEAYLRYLYTDEAQNLIAQNFYRPSNPKIAAQYASVFPKLQLVTIRDFGGWAKVQPEYFGDGGVFDQIYRK
ncbi:sulfate ABC transporter substrate-binding protein [Solimonas marina]|uniref:Sulfate ABC transporter substrate-binding protein n=1 Tax=Solimonas marina TaxID=2714601 RepID=A0A969W6Q9_9GAMM|nr:sulfate ABC transporter substrate-binding protein [Solimonas marina]NKF21686.1 sulfate ABC transporter substrate-binding protein [Solimonas marina]